MPATAPEKPLNIMDKSLQATLVREVFCHLDAGTTDLATATYRNPVTNYTDQQRFVRERTALFERLPLLVGLSCQIANPGDYLTRDHAGVRQLIVRGEDGVVRAFMNVCRHRGARIAEGQGQGQQRFKCPYHGWTYDCAGRLLGIPDKRNFPDLDQAAQEEELQLQLRQADRETRLLANIASALKRVETGEYGYCEETGVPIGLPRLLHRPTARLCLEAKQRQEQREHHFASTRK